MIKERTKKNPSVAADVLAWLKTLTNTSADLGSALKLCNLYYHGEAVETAAGLAAHLHALHAALSQFAAKFRPVKDPQKEVRGKDLAVFHSGIAVSMGGQQQQQQQLQRFRVNLVHDATPSSQHRRIYRQPPADFVGRDQLLQVCPQGERFLTG